MSSSQKGQASGAQEASNLSNKAGATPAGIINKAKTTAGKIDFGGYRKSFEEKYNKLNTSELLYDKLGTFQEYFKKPTISESRNQTTLERLKQLQSFFNTNKQYFIDHFSQNFGVSGKYVEDIFIPRLNLDIEYLIDNYSRFNSKRLNTEAYLANINITIRNIPLGQVLITSNDNMELTLRNVIAAIAAGNSVILNLGPKLLADETLRKIFAGLETALPECFRVADKIDDKIEDLGLVNVIGIEDVTELKKFATEHRAAMTVQNKGTNICIVADGYQGTEEDLVEEILNSKLELAGRTDNAISHWFIHRKFVLDILPRLEILIEREFEYPELSRDYYGKVTMKDIEKQFGTKIEATEFYTHPEETTYGIFRPVVVLNPTNPQILGDARSPLILIHVFDSEEELIQKVRQMNKVERINNIHYLTNGFSTRVGENLCLKLPGNSFHVNSLNPYIRSAGGNSNPLVTETRVLGGYNYIGLFSRRQLVIKRLFSGIESLNLYPLTNKKYDLLKLIASTSWLTRRRLKVGTIVAGLGYILYNKWSNRSHKTETKKAPTTPSTTATNAGNNAAAKNEKH